METGVRRPDEIVTDRLIPSAEEEGLIALRAY
jgi:hypothetical protein